MFHFPRSAYETGTRESLMADNNSSGQDTRHSGASGIPSAPSDCSSTRLSGPTSAKKVKRTRSTVKG